MGQLQFVKVSSITLNKVYVANNSRVKSLSYAYIDIGPTDPPPTTCSNLTNPTNGTIGYNMGTASHRPVGTVATYTCDTGYTLNGGTTRACVNGWIWSGSAVNCEG